MVAHSWIKCQTNRIHSHTMTGQSKWNPKDIWDYSCIRCATNAWLDWSRSNKIVRNNYESPFYRQERLRTTSIWIYVFHISKRTNHTLQCSNQQISSQQSYNKLLSFCFFVRIVECTMHKEIPTTPVWRRGWVVFCRLLDGRNDASCILDLWLASA